MVPLVASIACLMCAAEPGGASVDETVIRRLVEALKDSDTDVRQNLAAALATIGTPAVEPLIAALKDKITERRAGAAYTLGMIGRPARAALPVLLDLLKDDDVSVRRQASYAISRIVPASPEAPKSIAGANR